MVRLLRIYEPLAVPYCSPYFRKARPVLRAVLREERFYEKSGFTIRPDQTIPKLRYIKGLGFNANQTQFEGLGVKTPKKKV